jgi:hypothetical protein
MTETKPAAPATKDGAPIDPTDPVHLHSINEPHGSEVLPPPDQPVNLPGQPPETRRAAQPEMPKVTRDPDDIEDEIEAAKDDGDVKTGKKPGKR